jgi:hypothetical protein
MVITATCWYSTMVLTAACWYSMTVLTAACWYSTTVLTATCCCAHCSFDNHTKSKLQSYKVTDSVVAESEVIISKSWGGNQPVLVVNIICGMQHAAQT